MTEFLACDCRVLICAPDGYRVWPLKSYDQYEDDRTFFGLMVKGIGENGEPVTVNGGFIARIGRSTVRPKGLT